MEKKKDNQHPEHCHRSPSDRCRNRKGPERVRKNVHVNQRIQKEIILFLKKIITHVLLLSLCD